MKKYIFFRYYDNTEAYLKAVALKRMPPNLQSIDMLKAGLFLFLYLTCSSFIVVLFVLVIFNGLFFF